MKTRKLAVIILLVALSVGTNYAMMSFFNVKLMDLIVFIGGFCFGPIAGALIGVFSWAVYGVLNPLGFSLPVWLSTMFLEVIYGVAGALIRRRLSPDDFKDLRNSRVNICVFFGVLGTLLTLAYDVATNIVFGYVYDLNILVAVVVGFVPFGLVHMGSNACFFGVGCVPAINAVLNVIGGENSGISTK